MLVLTRDELRARKEFFANELRNKIFVYPTDTIYGIGCDALNANLVEKIRELKGRFERPFSVIAPSKEWILDFCEVNDKAQEWIDKLPGPYTLILPLKRKEDIPFAVNYGTNTLGVRIPNHWISALAAQIKTPIITTSANRTGENHMRSLDDLSSEWRDTIAYTIFEGELTSSPSTIIDLSGEELVVKKR